MDPEQYRQAVGGESSDPILNLDWKDKPHRLVYDLAAEVERLQEELARDRQAVHNEIRLGYDKTVADAWRAESQALRAMLWMRHGCVGIYGDDGEMQCGACLLDFKRDSVESIVKRFQDIGLAKLAAKQAQNARFLEQINSSPRSCRCSITCEIDIDNRCNTIGCTCVPHGYGEKR